jgi:hypothetical protein
MNSRVRTLYKIDPQPGAPTQARRIIAEELSSRLPDRTLDEIKPMVSELVAGGVVHARPGASVAQAKWRGRDLRVVEQLSDRWGMQCAPDRTEVWFERQCA